MDGTDGSGGPMVSRVELAILANGGGDYDEKACECDASVGATPCRSCAIRPPQSLQRMIPVSSSTLGPKPSPTSSRYVSFVMCLPSLSASEGGAAVLARGSGDPDDDSDDRGLVVFWARVESAVRKVCGHLCDREEEVPAA
jgi:hypothetical protein